MNKVLSLFLIFLLGTACSPMTPVPETPEPVYVPVDNWLNNITLNEEGNWVLMGGSFMAGYQEYAYHEMRTSVNIDGQDYRVIYPIGDASWRGTIDLGNDPRLFTEGVIISVPEKGVITQINIKADADFNNYEVHKSIGEGKCTGWNMVETEKLIVIFTNTEEPFIYKTQDVHWDSVMPIVGTATDLVVRRDGAQQLCWLLVNG